MLRGFARSLSGNYDHTDDLVQETLVKAIANRDKYKMGTNLHAWLVTILRNQYYSEGRRRWREVSDGEGTRTGAAGGAACAFGAARDARVYGRAPRPTSRPARGVGAHRCGRSLVRGGSRGARHAGRCRQEPSFAGADSSRGDAGGRGGLRRGRAVPSRDRPRGLRRALSRTGRAGNGPILIAVRRSAESVRICRARDALPPISRKRMIATTKMIFVIEPSRRVRRSRGSPRPTRSPERPAPTSTGTHLSSVCPGR